MLDINSYVQLDLALVYESVFRDSIIHFIIKFIVCDFEIAKIARRK